MPLKPFLLRLNQVPAKPAKQEQKDIAETVARDIEVLDQNLQALKSKIASIKAAAAAQSMRQSTAFAELRAVQDLLGVDRAIDEDDEVRRRDDGKEGDEERLREIRERVARFESRFDTIEEKSGKERADSVLG